MPDNNEDLVKEIKPAHPTTTVSSILRTIISLGLFIAVDYWIFKSWNAVFLLVSVLLVHECGHFIAMKIFGYQGIKMTFIPFLGAYVSGEASHFSKSKKIILLLAGPLPGIVIGMLLLFLYQLYPLEYYYLAAIAFLLLNIFNLIPVTPLDGGQVIETLFSGSSLVIQLVFLGLSLTVILYLLYVSKTWFLVVIAWLLWRRISSIYLVHKVRRALDKRNITYNIHYDDLDDEEYAQIRDILVENSRQLRRNFTPGEGSPREGELVSYIERMLIPYYRQDLSRAQRIAFISIYLLSLLLPLLQWALYKQWIGRTY